MRLLVSKVIQILIDSLTDIDTLDSDDVIPDLIMFLDENTDQLNKTNNSEVSVKEASDYLEILSNQANENEKNKHRCLSWLKALKELVQKPVV